jgi:Rps23 Pro-64 3,4-dihydroxylase Tpa1-like proline 4-hydroxylase
MDTSEQVSKKDQAFLSLRGRTVYYERLLSEQILANSEKLRAQFLNAQPFPHLVIDGLFSPELLESIWDDFGSVAGDVLKARRSEREVTFRTREGSALPASAQTYFDIVNSGRFVKFLTEVTGISGLIPDPFLQRGGLHESRDGGKFQIHVDFTKHPVTNLDNRLVLITYLNHDWQEDFGGVLELWGGPERKTVSKVVPEFGRSILMLHSSVSWHGHPTPIQTPDDRPRRSLAAYYYSNGVDDASAGVRYNTHFLSDVDETPWARTMRAVKYVVPPILIDAGRLLKGAARPKRG